MFRTFAQFLFKLLFPEGQGGGGGGGMKETFGNSGGEGGIIFLHKDGNSGEVGGGGGGLSWNSLRGGGMDIFWKYTIPGNNIHLMSGPEGNSWFCFPESLDVSRDEVEGNIENGGKTKLTSFPRDQTLSGLLYI